MEYIPGDLLDVARAYNSDGIVFSANSVVKPLGAGRELVMGAGVAKRVRDHFGLYVPRKFAKIIAPPGCVGVQPDYHLAELTLPFKDNAERRFSVIALQVKRHYQNPADAELVEASCIKLSQWFEEHPFKRLVMNMPGVGLGQLDRDVIDALLECYFEDYSLIVCRL